MKFIKGLLLIVLALILVYFIIAIFSPTSAHVEREIEIEAPAEEVWSKISEFKNWEAWSPWKENDPSIINTFTGENGAVGSKMSWTSDSSGVGYMEILETRPNELLKAKLAFIEPRESNSENIFVLTEENGKSILSWSDHSEFSFFSRPFMLLMGINSAMMDSMMGPDFEKGLLNIKNLTENSIGSNIPIEITHVEMPSKNYLGIRHKTTIEEVMQADFYGTNYAKIGTALGGAKLAPAGSPVAIYYSWNMEDSTTEIVPALPVAAILDPKIEGVEFLALPAGKAVKAAYYGPYKESVVAHFKLDDYCKANGIETGLTIEEYANDPESVSSPNEILTNIYYYIVKKE